MEGTTIVNGVEYIKTDITTAREKDSTLANSSLDKGTAVVFIFGRYPPPPRAPGKTRVPEWA